MRPPFVSLLLGATLLAACGGHYRLSAQPFEAERLADGKVKVDIAVRCVNKGVECNVDRWCARVAWFPETCEQRQQAPATGQPITEANVCADEHLGDDQTGRASVVSPVEVPSGGCIEVEPASGYTDSAALATP